MNNIINTFSINKFYKPFKNKVFIIAEIGVNHEGSVEKCVEMIISAIDSGADAIKIQTMDPDENYCEKNKSYKIFSKSKLTNEETSRIFDFCKSKNIKIFTTVGDEKSLNFIRKLKPFAYKVSSGLLNHFSLLEEILKINKPTVISTGMANEDDLNYLKKTLDRFKNEQICILHCVSLYPTPLNLISLESIQELKEKFNLPVGYSDHNTDILIPSYAVLSGAVMIEKHFTYDEKRKGYDHHISFNSKNFKNMVIEIRRIESFLSSSDLSENKKKVRSEFSRCLVASENLKKDQYLLKKHISTKRPDYNYDRGDEPNQIDYFIGKKLNRNLSKDSPLKKIYINEEKD